MAAVAVAAAAAAAVAVAGNCCAPTRSAGDSEREMTSDGLFLSAAIFIALAAVAATAAAAATQPDAAPPTVAQLRARLEGDRCDLRRLMSEEGCAAKAARGGAETAARRTKTVRTKTESAPGGTTTARVPIDPMNQE